MVPWLLAFLLVLVGCVCLLLFLVLLSFVKDYVRVYIHDRTARRQRTVLPVSLPHLNDGVQSEGAPSYTISAPPPSYTSYTPQGSITGEALRMHIEMQPEGTIVIYVPEDQVDGETHPASSVAIPGLETQVYRVAASTMEGNHLHSPVHRAIPVNHAI